MSLNSKLYKLVSYIQDNKPWESIYVILKWLFPCVWNFFLEDSNRSGTDKVFYYSRITQVFTIKSSSDIDNKELLPVSWSSPFKVWISSDNENEEEENIDTDEPESCDSDILEILISYVYSRTDRNQIHLLPTSNSTLILLRHVHIYVSTWRLK